MADNITEFEAKLDMVYRGEQLSGHLLKVTKEQCEKIRRDKDNYLWHTFWMFVLNESGTIIGSACFKGVPDIHGVVEIGYGTNKEYQNKGYTSEAISSLCDWALSQTGVISIIAETEKDNLPSQRVLEKQGFKIFEETDGCFWWRV